MSDMLEEDPFELFRRVEKSITRATGSMERLASEQDNRCQTISDAAEKASRLAVEASDVFSAGKRSLMIWTGLCAAILVSGGWLSGYWLGHSDGWSVGNAIGHEQALTENAASAWGNTPSGQLAHQMDKTGLLQALAYCHLPGYEAKYEEKEKRTFCYPTQNASGWLVQR
ncbi:replication protein [Acetobacter thailandicus]|uniref:Replication protein n=1 Tax=Acetobacter thailandicus TaxID=1502842 RepID=A0ABT3QHQ6_9PROT|nr:replication protein [Acetobacter thailandicus]MCX2564818.1 replication protein [Acetobacter thailandicus]